MLFLIFILLLLLLLYTHVLCVVVWNKFLYAIAWLHLWLIQFVIPYTVKLGLIILIPFYDLLQKFPKHTSLSLLFFSLLFQFEIK